MTDPDDRSSWGHAFMVMTPENRAFCRLWLFSVLAALGLFGAAASLNLIFSDAEVWLRAAGAVATAAFAVFPQLAFLGHSSSEVDGWRFPLRRPVPAGVRQPRTTEFQP